ncbi:class I adenylate-forming enzyme family protein [Vibrio mangrovi]|uniref:Class I adenylate-forming enzyme family protein n=1 Tax=Vibrio mangrovi TaxID=474394 RepID=A0A1Y6ISI0_9VIBR|nr:class I adenylate-forming enzyme family protein [Vibrio mangrovi]MDW6001392.1 class I adenylate-forming enzyme family protein [Vibrio mangrovi]SMS00586.1 Long-chain-fatty-acid--CoA ligase [Vibrio mangrovi]
MDINRQILSEYLDFSAYHTPEKIALIDADQQMTYSQLRHHALQLARYMSRQGVGRGDRVMLYMANSLSFIQCFWAIQYLGGVFIPVNPDTKYEKLAWLIDDSESALVVVDEALMDEFGKARGLMKSQPELLVNGLFSDGVTLLEQALAGEYSQINLVAPISQDLAAIIYTSGSTGTPKGVMLTQKNMVAASKSVSTYLRLESSDRIFCALPLSFDYGLHQVTMSALHGATLIIEASFSQPLFVMHRLVKQQATVFPIVPTMLSLIEPLAKRFDLSCVRTVTNTAAALHPDAIDKVQNIFSAARLYSMYGLTECHRCTYLEPEMLSQRKESVGKAIPNTEMWLVDDEGREHRSNATGELVIRGDTVMPGYWRNPEKTAEKLKPGRYPGEMVLYTGDICRLDDEGYLYFVGRKDEILKSCGEKVAPKEVETVIAALAGVAQVAVIGVPHAVYGDEIVAWVEQQTELSREQIKAWCHQHLESYMVPHRIFIRDSLPKNGNGKIDRPLLGKLSQPVETSEELFA